MKPGYLDEDFEYYKLPNCRVVATPGSTGIKRMIDGSEALGPAEHQHYRRSVGRLQWLCPIRPDICYPVKELARNLNAPTVEDETILKHVLKYVKGTLEDLFLIRPFVLANRASMEIEAFADSDWAGCSKTKIHKRFPYSIFGNHHYLWLKDPKYPCSQLRRVGAICSRHVCGRGSTSQEFDRGITICLERSNCVAYRFYGWQVHGEPFRHFQENSTCPATFSIYPTFGVQRDGQD